MSPTPACPTFRLDGHRAIVTGGTGGIGFAACAALAQSGAAVTLVARNQERVDRSVARLVADGHEVEGAQLDVTRLDDLREFFRLNEPFDIAVISAGMARHRPALETHEDDYDPVMGLNVRAAYFTAIEAARSMDRRGGSIIQISSQMGMVGGIDRSVYCASKHAIEGMTKAMAIEWADKGIRVNTICPTFIRTDLTSETLDDPERKEWILSKIKLGRIAEPADIMGAVVFLASDASSMITGTHILVDGGWTAG